MRSWSDHNENIESNKKKVTSIFQNLIGEKKRRCAKIRRHRTLKLKSERHQGSSFGPWICGGRQQISLMFPSFFLFPPEIQIEHPLLQ